MRDYGFRTWVERTHPEVMEEGMFGNMARGAALGAAALTGVGCSQGPSPAQTQARPQAQSTIDQDAAASFLNVDYGKGDRWHPYSFVGGQEVPDWKKAAENYRRIGKTGLKTEHEQWFSQFGGGR